MKRQSIERSKELAHSVRGVVGKPTLTDEETQRVVTVMRLLKRDRYDENGAALARALGVSQPNVSAILSGSHRPSYATAKRVAALYNVEVSDLLGAGPSARPRSVTPESHPNLFAALRMTRDQVRGSARENVVGAAERLPDLAQGIWVSILLDPSHIREEQRSTPRSRDPVTLEVPIESVPATGERVCSKKSR